MYFEEMDRYQRDFGQQMEKDSVRQGCQLSPRPNIIYTVFSGPRRGDIRKGGNGRDSNRQTENMITILQRCSAYKEGAQGAKGNDKKNQILF